MCQSVEIQISGLVKDQGLLGAVAKLGDRWGGAAFDIVDHWEANLNGIGLARRDDHSVLVYVDNFGSVGDTYCVELEGPPDPSGDLPYSSIAKYDSVSFEELSHLVGQHLGLAGARPNRR
jgi:hypothetical protein